MTMLRKASGKRRGITLVELLVVMIIMVILATVVVAFAPGFQDAQKVGRGADQLQGWLLMARQWAKKDRVPTGIRLSVNNVSGVAAVTDMQYVQQPPTFTVPYATPAVNPGQQPLARRISLAPSGTTSAATLDMSWTASPQLSPPTVSAVQQQGDFSGGLGFASGGAAGAATWPVQIGDYLVLHQSMYSITGFGSAVSPFCDTLTLGSPLQTGITSIPATTDYYFVRASRPLTGETTIKLPQDVIIDISQSLGLPSTAVGKTVDILFSPSGELLSPQFSSIGKVVLWVRDVTKPPGNTSDTLIAVDMRTGMIAAQPVNVGGADLYLFTKDGRSSGL
jgi:prepilin-type N-terminal cleavage/methylation domain-containing protein